MNEKIIEKLGQDLCDMAMGNTQIPDERVFTKEEVRLMINYKVEELWQHVQHVITEQKNSVTEFVKLPESEIGKLIPLELVIDNLDAVQEELEFPEFCNI